MADHFVTGDMLRYRTGATVPRTGIHNREGHMRRSLLAMGLICLLSGMLGTSEVRADSDFKVTLIGTASPTPRPDRFGPSTLVEAGDQKFLIDAGRGTPIRLWQMKDER